MNAEVSASIDTSRVKKAVVTYRIVPNTPYRIHNYSMDLSDPKIDSIAKLKPPHRSVLASAFRTYSDDYTSLIKDSALFDRRCAGQGEATHYDFASSAWLLCFQPGLPVL